VPHLKHLFFDANTTPHPRGHAQSSGARKGLGAAFASSSISARTADTSAEQQTATSRFGFSAFSRSVASKTVRSL
jgi:hypothetical protein